MQECQIAHHGCSDHAIWRVHTHVGDRFVICHELWISMHLSGIGDPYVTATYERIKEHT
jgi:hypothetical protein